ncbi:nitroreductase family protein [Ciceribacter sp. L1K23]|uniref:nitroreductase family protein n=1 Tax=Ciceribacter sp. L1K23 TaxID=2820276 RepID=UPI001B82D4AF|nr:nitroreductase family protein [Ciceribacter sp. L1K23]MBR0557640.1 nitroreductase family protein [Ciceribacter sp. L1K23]
MTASNGRISEFPIDSIFLDRWSPRSFTGEDMDHDTLLTIIEAARWAPSASNRQPWRIIYFLRQDHEFETALELLDDGNKAWARNASALIFVISDTLSRRPDGSTRPLRSHSFDAGAAWMAIALQSLKCGLAAHAMGGVNFVRAAEVLRVPQDHQVEVAVAIGKIREGIPSGDETPSGRRPLSEIAFRHVLMVD